MKLRCGHTIDFQYRQNSTFSFKGENSSFLFLRPIRSKIITFNQILNSIFFEIFFRLFLKKKGYLKFFWFYWHGDFYGKKFANIRILRIWKQIQNLLEICLIIWLEYFYRNLSTKKFKKKILEDHTWHWVKILSGLATLAHYNFLYYQL